MAVCCFVLLLCVGCGVEKVEFEQPPENSELSPTAAPTKDWPEHTLLTINGKEVDYREALLLLRAAKEEAEILYGKGIARSGRRQFPRGYGSAGHHRPFDGRAWRADHRAAILNAGIGRLNIRPDNLITSGCRVVDHIMSQLTAYSCHKYFHSCLYAPLIPVLCFLNCRFADLQVCRFAGLQICRFAGLQVCRSADSSQYHRGIICTDAARGACCPYTSRIQSVQQQVCQSLLKRSLV